MGTYLKTSLMQHDYPVYQHSSQDPAQFLFLLVEPDGEKTWRVGPKVAEWKGTGLRLKNPNMNDEEWMPWEYYSASAKEWRSDANIKLQVQN